MNEINLLKYHNRSAREIHMLLTGELTDEFFSRVVFSGKDRAGGRRQGLSLPFIILAAFICSLSPSYVIYTKYIMEQPITVPSIDKSLRNIMPKPDAPKKVEKPDPMVLEGYSKIGELEEGKGEGQQGVLIVSDYVPPQEAKEDKPDEKIAPITNLGEPPKRIPQRSVELLPIYSGNFKIVFNSIDGQASKEVKTLADNNDLKMTRIGSERKENKKWHVYKFDSRSSLVISGRKVRYIKSYDDSGSAMVFLEANNIKGLIVPETSKTDLYDIEVCCTSQELAQKLANASGIGSSKYKILNENDKNR
jgi:hypothetical protein